MWDIYHDLYTFQMKLEIISYYKLETTDTFVFLKKEITLLTENENRNSDGL